MIDDNKKLIIKFLGEDESNLNKFDVITDSQVMKIVRRINDLWLWENFCDYLSSNMWYSGSNIPLLMLFPEIFFDVVIKWIKTFDYDRLLYHKKINEEYSNLQKT
jgi:hypothetical protein